MSLEGSVISENFESSTMTDVDTIFKALRLVPEFDGNSHILPRFIHLCDQIVAEYLVQNPGNALANLCLVNGILNKITGPAARIINSNGIAEDWNSIKQALINNFSDQRDETALYNDLMLATQGNSSPQEFYDKCVNLFSTIMTYITLHETVTTTIEAKRTLYRKLTMQAFVRGLKEPLGSRIRCMRPDSAEKALEFVQEELNVMYLQNRNESVDKKPQGPQLPKPIPMGPVAMPAYKPFNFPSQALPMSNLRFPQQPWRPNNFNQPPNFGQYKPINMPSRTQQMFRALPPNYNASHNRFQMQPRHDSHNTGHKPMSGVSHYVVRERPQLGQLSGHDWRKHGNPPPTNYLKSREMNMNECASYNDYYYYTEPYGYNEPEGYYYVDPSDHYGVEPAHFMNDQQQCYDLSHEIPSNSYEESEPSTSSAEMQDFPNRGKLDKSK